MSPFDSSPEAADTFTEMPTPPANTRRVTADLPADLLDRACAAWSNDVAETIKHGLELIGNDPTLTKARHLRGRLDLDIDLEVSRERTPDR